MNAVPSLRRCARPAALAALVGLASLGPAPRATAQSLEGRPFRTLSTDTLPFGRHSLAIGLEYRTNLAPVVLLDPVSRGDLLQAPVLRYTLGLGRSQFSIGGPIYQNFSPDTSTDGSTHDENEVGDFSLWFQVQALKDAPGRVGLGFYAGTKMPNASDETGLGTDEADIHAGVILSHETEAHGIRLNLGIAILGDPFEERVQKDLLTYGLGGRHGRVHALIWEAWGQVKLSSTDRILDQSFARLGYAHFGEHWVFDVALVAGLTDESGDLGLSTGLTWFFGHPREPVAVP